MLELTHDQCKELQKRTEEKIREMFSDNPKTELARVIAELAVISTICTIREYERMQQQNEESK